MNHALCEGAVIPRNAARRQMGMSLVIATSVLLAAWLRRGDASASAPLLIMALGGSIGGWIVNRHAPVRGLPLIAAAVMTGVMTLGQMLGCGLPAITDGTLFMAVLLSSLVRTRSAGAGVIALLAGAELVALLI